VEARSYDLTVFKVKWGNLMLKIHDKGGRVLRIEVVALCAAAGSSTSYLSCSSVCARCSSGSWARCKQRTLRSWTKAPLSVGASQPNAVPGGQRPTPHAMPPMIWQN
jgi:hypothetical protein